MPTAAATPVALAAHPVHPLGSSARVLLSSVFGPYAQDDEYGSQDDEYGSRAINPMELYHNQVTRVQRAFSVRMFHRSWGLMLIQANISAHCTLLDFPSLDRFIEQLTTNHYDIVGISAIMPNVDKVRKMCALVREHLPRATVVVGGHIANLPGLDERIDADHIVRGDGVKWMRRFLSEDESRPIRHPHVLSGLGARTAGINLRAMPGDVAATLIPSVGCPLGCNFCATSAMFGGKGKFVHFFETGDELFEVMCELERALHVWSFFVMDENFLLYRKRALRLLDLMVEHNKPWALYVFSSANVLRSYAIEQLVGLGISWVWVGLEGKGADFVKLRGTDTRELVRTLQSHGIRVLGSSIIGLEEHTPQNIDEVIEYAVSHSVDFHQFMLYTPIPGTPLHEEFRARGALLDAGECADADIHGQLKFNFKHPHITEGTETELLLRAFHRDFEVNGPSISRLVRTTLQGWQRYKDHPDRRIRKRFFREARGLAVAQAGGLWAARRWFRRDFQLSAKIARILADTYREFGLKSRLAAPVVGRYLHLMMKREDRRLRRGWTYEPPTLCETSWIAAVGAHA
ncbi:MAG: B12-binding domain-containing radical SAM protein [Planctomycetota bacterium]